MLLDGQTAMGLTKYFNLQIIFSTNECTQKENVSRFTFIEFKGVHNIINSYWVSYSYYTELLIRYLKFELLIV